MLAITKSLFHLFVQKPIPPLKDYSMGTQDVGDFPMSTSSLTDWTEKKLKEKTLQAETELAKAIDNTEQEVKVGK